MPKLHLLDATYELFRAFFAMPSECSPDGRAGGDRPIGSTLGLLREPDVTHVGAATDHVVESFRNQLFAGYKTGEGVPPELMAQFPLAEEALRALGVVVWPMVAFEADDALAAAAARFADQVDQVVILSPDKDLCQCVHGNHIVTHRPAVVPRPMTTPRYRRSSAFHRRRSPDLLALVGDTADGIPGIPGFGMKTAAAVLRVYGTIEQIPPTTPRVGRLQSAAPTVSLQRSRRGGRTFCFTSAWRRCAPMCHCASRSATWNGAAVAAGRVSAPVSATWIW